MNIKGKLFQSALEEKRHYKMYKSGRTWVVAGISLLFAGALMVAKPESVSAAEDVVVPTAVSAKASISAPTVEEKQQDKATDAVEAPDKASDSASADATSVQTPENDAVKENVPASTQQSDQVANENVNSAAKQTVVYSDQSNAVNNDESSNKTADTNDDENQSSDTKNDPVVHNLGSASADEIAAEKASIVKKFVNDKTPQQITAVDPDPTVPLTGAVTITASGTSAKPYTGIVGYNSGVNELTVHFYMNGAKAGDEYSITIPTSSSNSIMGVGKVDTLNAGLGSTAVVQSTTDGSTVITNTFTADSSINDQKIIITLTNNAYAKPTPMPDVGAKDYQITWSITPKGQNAIVQDPVDIRTQITPTAEMTAVSRVYPDFGSVDAILPNTEYVYRFSVNEADGVLDSGYESGRVNSAVNYGTTIDIPVPKGFKLDEATTKLLNSFTDQTTIVQRDTDSDIIITVPKASGNQNCDSAGGYQLAGSFDVLQTADNQTLSAPGPVTMKQKTDDFPNGQSLAFSNNTTWTEQMLGTTNQSNLKDKCKITCVGNNSYDHNHLTVDAVAPDAPTALASFSFKYESPADTNDAKLLLTIPDGANATSVLVPAAGITRTQYLPGTTSYDYVMTLANGTTISGNVKAGDKVTDTKGSPIRSIVFTPNKLAAGAFTGNPNYFDANNPNASQGFQIFGGLAMKYDDGQNVKAGDPITFEFSVNDMPAVLQKETVVAAYATLSVSTKSSTAPDGTSENYISIEGSDQDAHTTSYIYEPILYYVMPEQAIITGINDTQGAKVTKQMLSDGRMLVKIDYSGTNESVNIIDASGSNNTVRFVNAPDAMPADYPYETYVYSPETHLTLMDDSSPVKGLSFADGKSLYSIKQGVWTIAQARALSSTTMAKSSLDSTSQATVHATVDEDYQGKVGFTATVVNTFGESDDVTLVLNLPNADDPNNASPYTFKLDGPIDVPTNFVDALGKIVGPTNAKISYSTSKPVLETTTTSDELSGYIDSSTFKDWGNVKSIKISFSKIPDQATTGRISLTGNIYNKQGQQSMKVGDTVHIESALFSGQGGASLRLPNTEGSLTVIGKTHIGAKAEYTDEHGTKQFVDLPGLEREYVAGSDTINSSDFPAEIPGNEALPVDMLQEPGSTLTVVEKNGDPVNLFGKKASASDDGAYVLYKLIGLKHGTFTTTRTINYVTDGGTPLKPTTQSVTWKTTQLVANDGTSDEVVATPQANYYATSDPIISGYTIVPADANKGGLSILSPEVFDSGNKPGDITLTVHYTPDNQVAVVHFVDEHGNELEQNQGVQGTSDGSLNHEEVKNEIQNAVDQGYNLVLDGTVGASFDHDDGNVQTYVIKFKKINKPVEPNQGGSTQPNGGNINTPLDNPGSNGASTKPNEGGNGETVPDLPMTLGTSPRKPMAQSDTPDLPITGGPLSPDKNGSSTSGATDEPDLPQTGGSLVAATSNDSNVGRTLQNTSSNDSVKSGTDGKVNLPQTGDKRSSGMVAMGMAMLSGLMVLAGKRRKNE